MIVLADISVPDSGHEISLAKLIGKPIADIRGYLSNEWGDPFFKMTRVEFADGTFLGCEGEHDTPYLTGYGPDQPNYDAETLERLYREQNPEEDDDD